MEKVIRLEENASTYIKFADKMVAEDNLIGALSMLKSARAFNKDLDVLVRIADVYADMGLIEISNRYWYQYMHVAPKEKISMAYEELGINYFYLDNLWATGFYFHKKIETDGFISKEGIDKEIIDFLSGDEFKKYAYRVVYPPERADYSLETKSGKRALALGAFNEAVLMLEKIPERARTEENSDDLTVAYFMSDDLESAEKESRRALSVYGESVWVYCNLSTIYGLKKDKEKSDFYYRKAISLTTGDRIESYKIMTCAIELEDHERVKNCLDKVLDERPYEVAMLFFYGIAYINLGKYSLAVESLKKAYLLDNSDVIIEYYYQLAKQFESGEGEEKLLPLKYEKRLPKKVESRWNARIKYLLDQPQKFVASLKNADNLRLYRWCLLYGSESTMRSLAYNLATLGGKTFYKLAHEVLMLPEAGETQKRLMIYLLSMCGYKGKIGVVFGVFYKNYHTKRLACEKDLDNPQFLTAYALTMSKLVFTEIEDVEKIAKVTDKIYANLKGKIDSTTTIEDLASLIISECEFTNHTDLKTTCTKLHSDYKNVQKLKEMLNKGE